MVVRVVVACALLAGCGRFGFGDDAPADGNLDAVSDVGFDGASPLTAISMTAAPFSTTSTVFVDVPGAALTIPPSVGTKWLLLTAGTLESPTLMDVTVEARYLVDGVEEGLGGTQTSTPGHPGPWQHLFVLDGTAVPQQITYQLREATGAMAKLDTLDVTAIPLPPSGITYASNDPPHAVNATTRTLDTTLSFGPLSGDYIFLLLVNATDRPMLSDCFVSWFGPAGETWLLDAQNPRESMQSYLTMQRTTLDVANAQVSLYTYTGAASATVSYVRGVALRADAFASVDYARSDVFATSASAVIKPTVSLVPGASSATRFLYSANTVLDEDCNTVADAFRESHFTIDGVDTVISHATDNCSYEASYGRIKLLSTKPASLGIGFDSANGPAVEHYASELLLLGLP